MPTAPPFHPSAEQGEDLFEVTLRPRSFDQFVGQRRVVENLLLALRAAKGRGETLDHLLLSGLPGLGKTTLAGIVARDLGTQLHVTSGPAIRPRKSGFWRARSASPASSRIVRSPSS